MSFVHLHLHSAYSLVDGLPDIKELAAVSAEQGVSAIALTDFCNLFALVKFYRAAKAKGVKPIIGSELLIQNPQDAQKPYRLLLLCQNTQGYKNLSALLSRGYLESTDPERPLIQQSWLQGKSEGLIAIAVAQESAIATALASIDKPRARELFEAWEVIFPGAFYLELVRTGRPGEQAYLEQAVRFSEEMGCPLVATNDVRFLHRADFEAHEARVCIHEGQTLNSPHRPKKYTAEQYLKSVEEMEALFSDLPEALENSAEIAKRCNLQFQWGESFLPVYRAIPEGSTADDYLIQLAKKGLSARQALISCPDASHEALPLSVYEERLDFELKMIIRMGFTGYFLIVADFIQWARNNDVPVGPGRGSGAGSLVAYVLRITEVDPLKYQLLFERFLNPERVSLPDFDIDFCMEGRDRVIEYVTQTYGRAAVSQIITFGTMAAKAVIRDVGRVLGQPYGFVDKIAKLVPFEVGITLESAMTQEVTLRERYEQEEEVKALIDLAKRLEGLPRNAGKHAGGVVIAPFPLTEVTPLFRDAEGSIVTQFDKNDVETIGLVKFDFLGLRTLTIIDWTVKNINEQRLKKGEPPLAIETLPMDDQKTLRLVRACQTVAVFQIESRSMKELIHRLQPDSFEEIVAVVALNRPGPLESGMVEDYINRKHKKEPVEYLHPSLATLLEPTYGVILYQEQVMQIAQVLAGYTLGAADLLRKAMGKKKPEEMAKQRSIFVQGAVDRGVLEATATHIFDLMEKFAGYGFNRSHSVAYALLTYQTAWLKAHYPAEFMAAVLSSDMANTDKISLFVEDCRSLSLQVLPPDVNQSQHRFSVNERGQILYGLGAVKGVGEMAIQSIITTRKKRPYRDLFDFCSRVDMRKVTKRVLEALIRCGAMDGLGAHRAALFAVMPEATLAAEQLAKKRVPGQLELFDLSLRASDMFRDEKKETVPPWSEFTRLQAEHEALGFYLTGHPIASYRGELHYMGVVPLKELGAAKGRRHFLAGLVSGLRTFQTKKGDRMAFVTLDDGAARQDITLFSKLYMESKPLIVMNRLLVVEGDLLPDDYTGGHKVRALQVMDLAAARCRFAKSIQIQLDPSAAEARCLVELAALLRREGEKQTRGCPVRISYFEKENSADSAVSANDAMGQLDGQVPRMPNEMKRQEPVRPDPSVYLGPDPLLYPSQEILEEIKGLEGVRGVHICYV